MSDMPKMVEVTAADANNYCRVLSALGMEEEGDPVQEITSIKDELAAVKNECDGLRAELAEAEKRRKPCTCHDTSRGPGRPCAVKAGTKLGKLWQCVEEPRRESAQAKSAEASGDPAPANNLPDWDECALRVRNSNFIAKRVAEGGYGAESVSKLATQLHRFIYEYDDADPYRSAWFRHRLELVLQEARRELSDEVEAVIACLEDDAAWLREQMADNEIATNMDEAAKLLRTMQPRRELSERDGRQHTHEARRWCSGDSAWSEWQPCTAEQAASYAKDETFQVRAARGEG